MRLTTAAPGSVTRARTLGMLGPTVEVVAVYYQQRFCLLRLAEFAEILLEIEDPARLKLLEKMRQLKRDLYHLLVNPRPLNLFRASLPPCSWSCCIRPTHRP